MHKAATLLAFAAFLIPWRLAAETSLPLNQIRLPPGFKIEIYADGLENARSMTLSPNGTLYVGTRMKGNVYAVKNREIFLIAKGLQNPNGVAFRNGSLYVMERSRLLRFDNIETNLQTPPKPVVLRDDYPTDGSHGWKFIAFGPDGRLYVPVGAPCNNCKEKDPIYASITRLSADGKKREIYAGGVRNTVGFDWHPTTKELWFTDNGRDMLGDDIPPDELNHAPRIGMDFGFPFCHGGDITDPEFGKEKSCSAFTPPARKLGPHVAALGMRFYTGTMFPKGYHHNIFIAEHGSWNRSSPIGYRIMRVRLKGNQAISYEVFAEGWLQKSGVWGRPVDVLVMPDGALLVSDDEAGVIYRISYSKP